MYSEDFAQQVADLTLKHLYTDTRDSPLFWVFSFVMIVLGSALGLFLKTFFGKSAETLATKNALEEIKRQTKELTTASEGVRQAMEHQYWQIRDLKLSLHKKLEELVTETHSLQSFFHRRALDASRLDLRHQLGPEDRDPTAAINAICEMYFPQLRSLCERLEEPIADLREAIEELRVRPVSQEPPTPQESERYAQLRTKAQSLLDELDHEAHGLIRECAQTNKKVARLTDLGDWEGWFDDSKPSPYRPEVTRTTPAAIMVR
jgi:hypothetical protein